MSSKNRPGSMAMMSSYSAALHPGIDDRKESRTAHAPSTASSNPGRRHTELVFIQPLRNKVSPSRETREEVENKITLQPLKSQNECKIIATLNSSDVKKKCTVMSGCIRVHFLSQVREDRSDRPCHSVQDLF